MTNIIGHRAHIIIRWAALFVALIVVSASLLQAANMKQAKADTDGYGWTNAPCASSGSNLGHTTGSGYWCSSYNWGESTCPSGDGYCTATWKMNGYYLLDQWGEGFRNCVSYAAWKLNQQFGINPISWGNGRDWNASALAAGYTDDPSPQVGDIAQWDASGTNAWGHVAYVYAVHSGVASYDEYNYAQDGTFQTTYSSASGSQGAPTHWIHIGTLVTPPAPTIPSTTLTQNGDFTSGSASWTASAGTNLATYASNQFGPQSYYASYSGHNYATTGSSSASGFYQDIPLPANSSTGQTFCVTAEVRTSGGSSGGGGALALFQMGGSSTEGEGMNFGPLTDNWQPIETCDTATTAHTTLRVEFYPTVNGPMLDIDNVDVHLTSNMNGDFLNGSASWTPSPGTNLAIYSNNQFGPQAYFASYDGTSGTKYASTNASSPSGFYQDIPVTTTTGQTYCVTAQVRTSNGITGGSGALALFQLGGSTTDGEGSNFGSLTTAWQPIETCSTATTSHTSVRVEFYPTVNGPTIDVANVDVHPSLALNGDFLNGSASWTTSTGTNLAIYGSNQLGPQPYFASYPGTSGTKYASTNASSVSGFYQDIAMNTTAGQTVCANAQVRSSGGSSGAGGSLALFLLYGGPTDGEGMNFSSLGNTWQPIQTCVVATSAHPTLRIEFYPTVGAPTLDVDEIDLH